MSAALGMGSARAAQQQVIDDVAILEAALERATERKRAQSPRWTPGREVREETYVTETAATATVASVAERERFSKAVSAYAVQLKAWVDMQVDVRLKLIFADIEGELAAARQESAMALDMARVQQETMAKVEKLMFTVDDLTRRETVEVQQETLATVEGLMRTVDDLKRSIAQDDKFEEMRRLHMGHDKKLAAWRAEVTAELIEEIRAVDLAWKQQAMQKRELENFKLEVQRDLEELRTGFERFQKNLSDELLAHQVRLVSELRAETTKAFSNEAKAVTALDEQLWLTDQRLGQRIDKIEKAVLDAHRESERRLEELMRSHNECLTAITRSHREYPRSPEHRVLAITEREPLHRPEHNVIHVGGTRAGEHVHITERVVEEAGLPHRERIDVVENVRVVGGSDDRVYHHRASGPRERVHAGERVHVTSHVTEGHEHGALGMARLAAEAFDDHAHTHQHVSQGSRHSVRGTGALGAARANTEVFEEHDYGQTGLSSARAGMRSFGVSAISKEATGTPSMGALTMARGAAEAFDKHGEGAGVRGHGRAFVSSETEMHSSHGLHPAPLGTPLGSH